MQRYTTLHTRQDLHCKEFKTAPFIPADKMVFCLILVTLSYVFDIVQNCFVEM